MAHNIQILESGNACFVEATHYGEIKPAWHGLGTQYDDPMTSEFAMKEAHADFEVSMQPVVALTPDLVDAMNSGSFINASMLKGCIIEGSTCNVRMDINQPIAITSDKYGLIQNADAFRFISNICGMEDNAPVIDTMGVLNDGSTFASIRMKSIYDLGKGDDVDMYLIVKNSFNSKEALSVFTAFQRVVCQNTLNAAFRNAQSKLLIRHTRYANNRLADIENAAKTLKFYELYKEEFMSNMERLKTIKLTDKQCEKIICKTIMTDDAWSVYEKSNYDRFNDDLSTRTKNQVENALNVMETGVGQKECADKGTGLWVYNGITTLYANHTKFKDDEKKFNSIFGGGADGKQQKAFELISNVA